MTAVKISFIHGSGPRVLFAFCLLVTTAQGQTPETAKADSEIKQTIISESTASREGHYLFAMQRMSLRK
jgi:hypothetical protein